ncbi:MAG: hypothetical protein M0010_15270 [Actinomycetota bacterium]|jgi:hypothetical protein|nr:hypothetical protein [Actinomycetota bacterium]
MLTKLLDALGTATDVRTVAAVVIGVLVTVLPAHLSVVVKSVVDGLAGVVVVVDQFQLHKTKREVAAHEALAKSTSSSTSSSSTSSTGA